MYKNKNQSGFAHFFIIFAVAAACAVAVGGAVTYVIKNSRSLTNSNVADLNATTTAKVSTSAKDQSLASTVPATPITPPTTAIPTTKKTVTPVKPRTSVPSPIKPTPTNQTDARISFIQQTKMSFAAGNVADFDARIDATLVAQAKASDPSYAYTTFYKFCVDSGILCQASFATYEQYRSQYPVGTKYEESYVVSGDVVTIDSKTTIPSSANTKGSTSSSTLSYTLMASGNSWKIIDFNVSSKSSSN